jgi:aerobic-type carbon monoxide dehydrogenase small subunit (CoxS/CutS family)
MLMAAAQLLERSPNPDMPQIREALAGNLCRCTGFIRIFESVAAAVDAQSASPATKLTTEQMHHAR